MGRPITLFTAQWTDLPFEEVCDLVGRLGYDGLEIACWGDHLDVERAAKDLDYVAQRKKTLATYGLKCWALANHLAGQCVGDPFGDPRLDGFAPKNLVGKSEKIREWGIQQMMYTAQAAKNMGVSVVTGFMGSPIWRYIYSFPDTTEAMVEDGFAEIKKLWTPILDEFDRCGVKFALEVHPAEIAYDYYTAQRLLEVFEYRETLGFNFDPSHFQWQGVDPALFFRDFADFIYHIHIKDCYVKLDGRSSILGSHQQFGDLRRGWNFVSPGHGDVNFEFIIREANAANYTGPFSVEWEDNGMDRHYGAKEALAFVKKIDFDV